MVSWNEIQSLPVELQQRINNFYKERHFHLQIRSVLDPWIEQYFGTSSFHNSPEIAAKLCKDFLDELNRFPRNVEHAQEVAAFRELLQVAGPLRVCKTIQDGLAEEGRLIQSVVDSRYEGIWSPIVRSICAADNLRVEFESRVAEMTAVYNNSAPQFQNMQQHHMEEDHRSAEETITYMMMIGREPYNVSAAIRNHREQCCALLLSLVADLESCKTIIADSKIPLRLKWSPSEARGSRPSLDDILYWLNVLCRTVGKVHNLLQFELSKSPEWRLYDAPYETPYQLKSTLQYLKKASLAVIIQPPPLLKRAKKPADADSFFVTVKLMIEDEWTNSIPAISLRIINRDQGTTLDNDFFSIDYLAPGPDCIVVGEQEASIQNGAIIYQFRDLRIQGLERVGHESAMMEKFCIMFHTTLPVCGEPVQMWCCTEPIVFYTNTAQLKKGLAYISLAWDKCVRKNGESPFSIDQQMPWRNFAALLDESFKAIAHTKRGLTPKNLAFLREKLVEPGATEDDAVVTWAKITPQKGSPPSYVSFWQWFFSAAKFVENHLRDAWDNGYVVGFFAREKAQEEVVKMSLRLQNKSDSRICMLRFPESSHGVICTAQPNGININFRQPILKQISLAQELVKKYTHIVFEMSTGEGFHNFEALKAFPPTASPPPPVKGRNPYYETILTVGVVNLN